MHRGSLSCDELGIKIGTVRTHISRIYKKLHVHNRTEAVLKAMPLHAIL